MIEALAAIPMLREFGDEDRAALADLLEARDVPEGSPLFRSGDEAEEMIFLVEGEVALEGDDGAPVGTLADGEVLGAVSLVAIGTRECSARAVKPTQILCLSREGYVRLSLDRPSVALALQEAVVRELAALLRIALKG